MRVGAALRAAVDRVIPADDWPGGWAGGVGDYLAERDADLGWARQPLDRLARRLDEAAGGTFATASAAEQDEVLRTLDGDPRTRGDLDALRRLCWEGYYAARPGARPAGLAMIGYRAVPEGVEPVEPAPLPRADPGRLAARYDAVVVGAGPGGGAAARVLTEGGRHVLVLERAADATNASLRADHLRGKRDAVYRADAGPGPGHPRVLVDDAGGETVVDGDGDSRRYGLNAMVLGGGTRLWQGMAWRFMPEDFRMETTYGNPDGAALADWPVDYDELEPWYTRAEHELGVSGEVGPLTGRTPRSAGYPMPPMADDAPRRVLAAAGDRLGWRTGAIPLALNSTPHDGRAACVRCPQCVGHACPVDAKNGAHNTLLPRALATGRAELLTDAQVLSVTELGDRVRVRVMARASSTPVELTVEAEVAVVAAGAVETPRLLRASGLGNDHVGRYLHDHRFAMVTGLMAAPVKDLHGPGHSVATLDHVHTPSIPWGGGVLVDLMGLLPHALAALPPVADPPRWGAEHKRWMREGRRHVFGVFGMGQEIPLASSRVTLAAVRDRWGMPGARLRKDTHPASLQVEAGMERLAREWLTAAGATQIVRRPPGPGTAAGEHSCGTARMGHDPQSSATSASGRLHDSRRVWVADASLHPTNGSVNPALTVVANSLRVASRLLQEWPS